MLSPIRTATGLLVASAIRDASSHQLTRDSLRESEERYRLMIESTHELVQSVTPDGHFAFVNRAWKEVLGYSDVRLYDGSMVAWTFDATRPLESGKSIWDSVSRWVSG